MFPGDYTEVIDLGEGFQVGELLFSSYGGRGYVLPAALITDGVSNNHSGQVGFSSGEEIHFPYICYYLEVRD